MRKKMLVKEIELRIASLEQKISENIGDLESMKRELNRLKLQAFEEDMREQNQSSQLLQG
jgi:pyrimidine operon attenuation protein/uracil phosphoribosyltransferase